MLCFLHSFFIFILFYCILCPHLKRIGGFQIQPNPNLKLWSPEPKLQSYGVWVIWIRFRIWPGPSHTHRPDHRFWRMSTKAQNHFYGQDLIGVTHHQMPDQINGLQCPTPTNGPHESYIKIFDKFFFKKKKHHHTLNVVIFSLQTCVSSLQKEAKMVIFFLPTLNRFKFHHTGFVSHLFPVLVW